MICKHFNLVFGSVLEKIIHNKPLKDQPILMAMALVRQPIRALADTVDSLQKEKDRFNGEFSGHKYDLVRAIYPKKIAELKGRLDRRLQEPLRFEANRLLEVADQMKLLDYVSGLDENRIQALFESRGYKSQAADSFKFDTLYWPLRSPASSKPEKRARNEFWFDEMPNLRVLISDRCHEGSK